MFWNNKEIKIGVAFGGGGARGLTHLGAVKAFEEFGIKFDRVAGTSAGAIMGAFYSAGYSFAQMYEIAKNVDMKEIKTSKVPFIPSKLDGVGQILKRNLGDINIEDLKIPFSAVAVNLVDTKETVFSKGNLANAVMGSCAVPAVFQPIEYNNMILADGGLQNTIPADILRYYGCDYVVSIDVNKSRTYGTNSTKLTDVFMCSIRILMKANAERGYKYSDVVIAPETKRFKATSSEGFDDMIEEGYNATIDAMPLIKRLFEMKRHSYFDKSLLKDVVFFD